MSALSEILKFKYLFIKKLKIFLLVQNFTTNHPYRLGFFVLFNYMIE